MKILPEHETFLTIMSKLIQVVWITFELPIDDINISNNSDTISKKRDDIAIKKKSTFHDDDTEEESHYYDDGAWNSISSSSASIMDLSLLSSSTGSHIVYSDVQFIPPDSGPIENMIEHDVPCRVTGVLARGVIYW